MSSIPLFTPAEKMKAAEAEAAIRRGFFGRKVTEGKMTEAEARDKVEVMESIAADYRDVVGRGQDPRCPLPQLKGTHSLVVYFQSKAERDAFVKTFQSVKPSIKTIAL